MVFVINHEVSGAMRVVRVGELFSKKLDLRLGLRLDLRLELLREMVDSSGPDSNKAKF